MKRINILLVFFAVIFGVNAQNSSEEIDVVSSFGAEIDNKGVLDTNVMTEKYRILTVTDTLQTKFTATVTDVCKAKGCWMKLKMVDGSETMVKFKDYGFFVPTDIKGQQVIVNGKAFIEEMSVADQKHYAQDGGRSAEEIARITQPKKTYGFEADGVLLDTRD